MYHHTEIHTLVFTVDSSASTT